MAARLKKIENLSIIVINKEDRALVIATLNTNLVHAVSSLTLTVRFTLLCLLCVVILKTFARLSLASILP